MEEGEIKPHLFDGWDDTPSYDGSQTNAIKCFSDIFQQQIKIEKKQLINGANKCSPKNKQNQNAGNQFADDGIVKNRKKDINFFKKEMVDPDSKIGMTFYANQTNRDNKPFRHHVISSGIQDACVFEVNKDSLTSTTIQTQQNNYSIIQDLDNKQIFMKKNVFQDRTQRNQSLDQAIPFYNNTTQQTGRKYNLSSIHQTQETSSSEGRRKSKKYKQSDESLIKNKFNASINLSILKTNYDDKSQYNFLNNTILDSIGSIKGEEFQKQIGNLYTNGTALTQMSQQSDNDNISSAIDITEPISLINQPKRIHQQDFTSMKSDTNTSNQNIPSMKISQNKQNAKENNQQILIVTPEKFIPFHKQEGGSNSSIMDYYTKIKSSALSRNSQKQSQTQIPILENENVKYEKINISEINKEGLGNDLTNSFRQHQQSLQQYRNSIRNCVEEKMLYSDKKCDPSLNQINSNEKHRNSIISRNQDQSRLSQRASIVYSKQKNEKIYTKSQSPSNNNNRNTLRNSQDQQESFQKMKEIATEMNDEGNDKSDQTIQFSAIIQGRKYLTQNSCIDRPDTNIKFRTTSKDDKLFTVSSQIKQKDHLTSLYKKIENPTSKFITEQGLQPEVIPQYFSQNNELFPYSGVFNATTTQFNYQPKKNKSLEPFPNQIPMGDNIFCCYQQNKLPILKFKKKNQNEFLKLINNKIIDNQKQHNQQNYSERSKEKLNGSSIIGSSSKSSNYEQFHPLFRTPQQDKHQIDQRIGTAGDGKRLKQTRINTRSTDKRSTPIKAINQIANNTQQFMKTHYYGKNQSSNQQNNQIVQYGGKLDNSGHIQSFLLTNYKRSPSMEQSEQPFLNTETMYNNNQLQNTITNNNHHLQTDSSSYNDVYSSRKNKFRIFQHNYMYKTISPN